MLGQTLAGRLGCYMCLFARFQIRAVLLCVACSDHGTSGFVSLVKYLRQEITVPDVVKNEFRFVGGCGGLRIADLEECRGMAVVTLNLHRAEIRALFDS